MRARCLAPQVKRVSCQQFTKDCQEATGKQLTAALSSREHYHMSQNSKLSRTGKKYVV